MTMAYSLSAACRIGSCNKIEAMCAIVGVVAALNRLGPICHEESSEDGGNG